MRVEWLPLVLLMACSAREPGVRSDPRSDACATCHPTQFQAWKTSGHAASAGSPILAAMLPRVAQSWGEDARERCTSCHAPKHGGDDAIGCVSCHAAIGNTEERNGRLVVDLGAPIRGPFADPRQTAAHGSRYYDLLLSPVLCGTCHEVKGPAFLDEPTLTEHRGSPAARAGLTCASCHMPEIEVGLAADGMSLVRRRADHGFVGFDPPWGAPPDEALRREKRTRRLLASALALDVRAAAFGVDVRVATGIMGHAVPTGAAFLRRIWVDVDFVEADGKVTRIPSVIELGSRPTKNGAPVALMTDADAFERRVLLPDSEIAVHVERPAGLSAPVRATATLRAQAVRPEILDALLLGARASEVPTHVLAEAGVDL